MPFAPTPINIQYGDPGVLGTASAQAGYGQGLLALSARNRGAQQAQDAQILGQNFQLQQAANQAGAQQAQQFQANQLQQAHDAMLERLQNQKNAATSPNYFTGKAATPMAKAIRAQKQLAVDTITGSYPDLSPDIADKFRSAVDNPDVSVTDINNNAKFVKDQADNTRAQKQYDETNTQRQAEEARRVANDKAAAEQRKASLNATNSRTSAALRVRAVDTDLKAAQTQAAQLAKTASFDVNGDETQFAARPGPHIWSSEVPADTQGLTQFRAYKALQDKITQLQTAKDAAVQSALQNPQGGDTGSAGDPGSSSQTPVPVNSPAEAAALPSGTFFKTPDGKIIQKH